MGAWKVTPDIKDRIRALRAIYGLTQEQLAAMAGRRRQQVLQWEKGDVTPPRSSLERLAMAGKWPVEMFMAGAESLETYIPAGQRPPESHQTPYTDPGLTAGQVAERLVRATAPRPLTANLERIQRAVGAIELALQDLKVALSEARRGTDDLIEFVKSAEAGHPSQPPPAVRKGKSG